MNKADTYENDEMRANDSSSSDTSSKSCSTLKTSIQSYEMNALYIMKQLAKNEKIQRKKKLDK